MQQSANHVLQDNTAQLLGWQIRVESAALGTSAPPVKSVQLRQDILVQMDIIVPTAPPHQLLVMQVLPQAPVALVLLLQQENGQMGMALSSLSVLLDTTAPRVLDSTGLLAL